MSRKSIWADSDILSATIRQLAIDNGTPNVMPTIEQMTETLRNAPSVPNEISQQVYILGLFFSFVNLCLANIYLIIEN